MRSTSASDRCAGLAGAARRAGRLTAWCVAPLLVWLGGCATTQPPRDGWPPPCPPALRPWLGEYGDPAAPMLVAEWQQGTLRVMRPGVDDVYLTPVEGQSLFFEAGSGLVWKGVVDADGRHLVAPDGARATALARFPEQGATFRIEPRFPLAELRARAAAATPPENPPGLRAAALVPITDLAPDIVIDLRYATDDNFLGMALYDAPIALLQRPAAEALARAQRRLAGDGLGLVVFDAYRPWSVTHMFFDATPPEHRGFVADPSRGSRHNRGMAVDVGLIDLATGEPLEMPSGFDEFSDRARTGYRGGTVRQRWAAWILRLAMTAEGFQPLGHEWWHFDHREWREYPVLDVPLAAAAGTGAVAPLR